MVTKTGLTVSLYGSESDLQYTEMVERLPREQIQELDTESSALIHEYTNTLYV